jgi:hypothetical protein
MHKWTTYAPYCIHHTFGSAIAQSAGELRALSSDPRICTLPLTPRYRPNPHSACGRAWAGRRLDAIN